MDPVIIRPYKSCDKEAVRQICCDTADLGGPVESFFYDRRIFADLITGYYIDFEPQSLWVADCQGRVAGYLTGCLDSRRYTRIMIMRIIPKVFSRAILCGAIWHRDSRRMFESMLRSHKLGGFNRKDLSKDYPAHLHINLAEGFRHQGLGLALIEHFFIQVQDAHCPGVQVSVSEENLAACKFFEHMGFSTLGRYPLAKPQKEGGFRIGYTVIYGRRL